MNIEEIRNRHESEVYEWLADHPSKRMPFSYEDRGILLKHIEELEEAMRAGCEDMRDELPARTCGLKDQLQQRIEELEATIQRISQVPDRCRPCNTWEINMKAAQKPITIPKCVCVKCQHEQFPRLYYMPICPDCGDKRCDKAANHDNECQAIKGEGDV